jgi:acetylornithine deacetylase/succinyl-diaminopimelate desuccinylase-like protein
VRAVTALEPRLLADIDRTRSGLIRLLSTLIAAPSFNPPGDERLVAECVRNELAALGLPEPTVGCLSPERPNLLCSIDGRRPGRVLILNAHLDTKPPGDPDLWATDPFVGVVKDGRLYGLGASDMKSGAAAMVYAAATLAKYRHEWEGRLLLVLSADEEAGGHAGMEYLVRSQGLEGDFALIGEPSGVNHAWEFLYKGTRGMCMCWVRVRGTQTHAALADHGQPVKAAVKAAELQVRFEREFVHRYADALAKPGGFGLYPGVMVRGGVAPGVTPPWIDFLLDLRIPPGVRRQTVEASLRDFIAKAQAEDPQLDVTLTFAAPPGDWREPLGLAGDDPRLNLLNDVMGQVLGRRLDTAVYPAWTDSLWLQGLGGTPTVPAVGPGILSASHGPNESVALEDVVAAAKIYCLFAHRFFAMETRD